MKLLINISNLLKEYHPDYKENGFLKDGQFDSYDRAIKRGEMAELFYNAMPEGFYKRINNVTVIPDADKNASCDAKWNTFVIR